MRNPGWLGGARPHAARATVTSIMAAFIRAVGAGVVAQQKQLPVMPGSYPLRAQPAMAKTAAKKKPSLVF